MRPKSIIPAFSYLVTVIDVYINSKDIQRGNCFVFLLFFCQGSLSTLFYSALMSNPSVILMFQNSFM